MNREELKEKFCIIHNGDSDQLDFIMSEEKRIFVTAPAGCGKTKTMISKIAYELITKKSLNLKNILALTFSVNASSKIREDVRVTLPVILDKDNYNVDQSLDVSNYHGFATKLIRKHGYILHENLKNIDDFLRVPDNSDNIRKFMTSSDIDKIQSYDKKIKDLDFEEIDNNKGSYLRLVIDYLVPNNIITYNSLILLGIELLKNRQIHSFYREYYKMIIIDEFQDTNYLALQLILQLMDVEKVILMGDDIQKIYGFLGAVPNIFNLMKKEYNMVPMELKTNYRFINNPNMLKLDKYIRGIFKNYNKINNYDDYLDSAKVKFKLYTSDSAEVNFVCNNLKEKIEEGKNVSILVRAKYLADEILKKLEEDNFSYFNGLFDDTDKDYIKFHNRALDIFINKSGVRKSVRKSVRENVIKELKGIKHKITDNEVMFQSLIRLLKALFNSIANKHISSDDKYNLIIYTLNSNSLKRLMNELNEQVIITTIHGSKGLEWDYVYLPFMNAYSFPGSKALCRECRNNVGGNQFQKCCRFKYLEALKDSYLGELSVYYVALTRAREDVFLSANTGRNNYGYNKKVGCFVVMPKLILEDDF